MRADDLRPDDLVPRVLLGQPIEPGTPLTRVQPWLLFADGFLSPGTSTALVSGALLAATGPAWGTANAVLPGLASPDPRYSSGEWTLLLAHLAVIGWTIPFDVSPLVIDTVWLYAGDSQDSGFGTRVWRVEARYDGPGAP